ncbi:MAG: ABC transporter permease [Spirochaetaceae bacterium]|jgi:putative ABC transport system permease protein|nr:ABC transporter permease [Spirochaetaceae bacterium]
MNVLGTVQLGLIYTLLALGVFIAFRVMNTPDLTADGSFTLGLCAGAIAVAAGHPFLGLLIAFATGAAAGIVTGLLQTAAGIHPILAGILTMTGLYSINILVLDGSPNKSLIGSATVFTVLQEFFPAASRQSIRLCFTALIAGAGILALIWFFKTSLGLQIRATGSNRKMVRSSSINPDKMQVAALAIANAYIGLSGGILAQYQGYADINSGSGIVIIGLASVIIGETLLPLNGVGAGLVSASLGAICYRFLIALVLYLNIFPASMLKLLSAFIVALALSAPKLKVLVKAKRGGAGA